MAEMVKEHKIVLINKKLLNVSGVIKVNSVNENYASLEIIGGGLVINGKTIKMKKLIVEEGIVEMEGEFVGFKYGAEKQKGNFFKRIFK